MSAAELLWNLGAKAGRRLRGVHKPIVRAARRHARAGEEQRFAEEADGIDDEIARIAASGQPIVAGPWLAEVGYEVLYWIPFLRWLQNAHGVAPERIIAISRGGMEQLYRDVASRYLDIFDVVTPEALAARNEQRRADHEGGGQKQSTLSALDEELIAAARSTAGATHDVLHPSLMFRLFRRVWHGNLPYDVLWRHTRHVRTSQARDRDMTGLPREYVAVKLYTGPALSAGGETAETVRRIVAQVARQLPVVALETQPGLDEHRDLDLSGIPGVISARTLMEPRNNLDVQTAIIARAKLFVGACGGLAWLAPFMDVPAVALYDSDRLLLPHLYVARSAGRAAGAANFAPLDVNALARVWPLQ